MQGKKVRKMTELTMLLALGVVLHYAEGLIELPAIPGVRFGFANIIGLICLHIYGPKEMLEINFGRVVFASLLNGRLFSTGFFLSLSGVALCSIVSIIVWKIGKFSILGISVLSGVFHGVGQILAVMVIYNTSAMIYYLPVLTLAAIPTGLFTGYIAYFVLLHTKGGIKNGN